MNYPLAPTSFDELMLLIPPRGKISVNRFTFQCKPFELRIGRNDLNVVWMEFSTPDGKNEFWPSVRTVESLTRKRDIWAHWQLFLEHPDDYSTWGYIGKPMDFPKCQ